MQHINVTNEQYIHKKCPLPLREVWFWLFTWKSSNSGALRGEETTWDSDFVSIWGGGEGICITTNDDKLKESQKRRRKARPTKKNDAANLTQKRLWFCSENNDPIFSDLILSDQKVETETSFGVWIKLLWHNNDYKPNGVVK